MLAEITVISALATTLIKKIWPDPEKQAEQLLLLADIERRGNLEEMRLHTDLILGQLDINKAAAEHPSVWVAGPRPACIWIGAATMAWCGIVHPMLLWVWAFAGITGDPPPLIESASIMAIMSGLLGVAGYRSIDKYNGTQTDRLGK